MIVVNEKPDKMNDKWLFIKVFSKKMWLLMVGMHLFVGFVIWLIENADNPEFKGFGAMLWFSVTVLFFIQSKYLANF
jgi:hypothetical protein